MATKGDRIILNARRVGGPAREGEILEVIVGEIQVSYRVRWSDGHESVFAPGAGTATIEQARARPDVGPKRTRPAESVSKAPAKTRTAVSSTTKSPKNEAAGTQRVGRSTRRKAIPKRGR